jgi:hypothetical protein
MINEKPVCEVLRALAVLTEQGDTGNVHRVELAIARCMSEFTTELATIRESIGQKGGG